MLTSEFDYDLPPDRIARVPADRRAGARLLVLRRSADGFEHRRAGDLPDLLEPGDLLVVNDSRVRPARLAGRRRTGGRVEILLVDPLEDGSWTAMARPGRKLRPGETLELPPDGSVRLEGREEDGLWRIRFPEGLDPEAFCEAHGRMPLPPYIPREDGSDPRDVLDRERYQTVYADPLGSCAAPTAGLHLDEALLARLASRSIPTARVTLHVGPGTFRPVKAERIEDHRMHRERFTLSGEAVEAIAEARARGGRVVAVGTTTVRVLESAAAAGGLRAMTGATDLFLRPGSRFRVVDALLTNFHLPRSSLLMLVSAFAGRERVMAAYAEAVREGYRFYSYGDAMLLL